MSKTIKEAQQRLDRISYDLNADSPEDMAMVGYTSKFIMGDDGFLSGKAVVTNVGVFSYLMADGTILRELRAPNEVFSQDSLNSLRLKPLTNDHPDSKVSPENVKELQVGSLGDGINYDSYRIYAPIVITEQQAIMDVANGKRALSCGYTADVIMESGVWMGVPYDAVQKNIRYNHVAIVDKGRAGDDATMRLDSAQQYGTLIPFTQTEDSMKSIILDGVSYNADAQVLTALHAAKQKADAAEASLSALTNEKSALQAKFDTASEQLEASKTEKAELQAKLDLSLTADAAEALVAARLVLLDTAKKAGVEATPEMKADSIKSAIIAKVFPKAKLDGQTQAYIDARFDAAVESLEESQATDAVTGGQVSDNATPATEGTQETKVDSAIAHSKYLEDQRNAHTRA